MCVCVCVCACGACLCECACLCVLPVCCAIQPLGRLNCSVCFHVLCRCVFVILARSMIVACSLFELCMLVTSVVYVLVTVVAFALRMCCECLMCMLYVPRVIVVCFAFVLVLCMF